MKDSGKHAVPLILHSSGYRVLAPPLESDNPILIAKHGLAALALIVTSVQYCTQINMNDHTHMQLQQKTL